MAYTSIQIAPETRKKLAKFKENERETYDELLNKLLSLIPSNDDEGEYTDQFRIGLLNSRLDIKHGKTVTHSEVKKSLGL